MPWSTLGRTDFGSGMSQSYPPRAARCYALRPSLSGSCPRPCGSEQASGMIIDGSGQEGAICGVDQPTITASSIEHVRAGKLRPLGVTTASRAAVLPDVPALAEFLPGYEASIYVGIAAPRNTPSEIIQRLSEEIHLALSDPKVTSRIADQIGRAHV